jgi:Spy/CpxP family protein refolding chaperone
MKGKLIIASLALVLCGSMLLAADEAPTTQPAAAASHRKAKLTKPWSDLTSLTDDQKNKIEEIHAAALDQEKEARAKERAEIESVLSDAQKAELQSVEGKTAADRKERAAAAKKKSGDEAAGPTTAPSAP